MTEAYAPRVTNLVFTAALSEQINPMIPTYALYGWRKGFPSAMCRIHNTQTTVLVFASGKVVVCGATNPYVALNALLLVLRELSRCVRKVVTYMNFRLQLRVGSAFIGYKLNLDMIRTDHAAQSKYEPDRFPGLRYKLNTLSIPVTLILFKSGKIVVTQTKRDEEMLSAYEFMQAFLPPYKLGSEYRKMLPHELTAKRKHKPKRKRTDEGGSDEEEEEEEDESEALAEIADENY
jgi:transcription initiation factor TFIID TATA-box-binding protein